MKEQENIGQRRRRKLTMIEVFLWYSGNYNPPPRERIEEATPFLREQGYIEEIEPPPHNPLKRFCLTPKGMERLPDIEKTFSNILRRHREILPTGPDPLDEVTHFD